MKNYKKILGLLGCLLGAILMCVLLAPVTYGLNSVILTDSPNGDLFTVECLGEDNLIFIYGVDENNPQGTIMYQGECDFQEKLKKQYLENALKIVIRNGEDSDTLINYEEFLNTIETQNANAKIEEFTDKVCVTVQTPRFSDIKIVEELTQQSKSVYKCIPRNELKNLPKTDLDSHVLVEVYINDMLFKEFKVKLAIQDLKISITDLGLLSEKNENFLGVTFKNPTSETLKVTVLKTNMACGEKTFEMGDTFTMICNKSTEYVPKYHIQVKDNKNRFTFKEFTLLDTDKGKETNWYLWGAILLGLCFFAYNRYKQSIEEDPKNKSVYSKLEEDKE